MDNHAELLEFVTRRVAEGFMTAEEIVEAALDFAEPDEADAESVRALVADALARHAAAQRTWTPPTDNDRLDTAFAALEAQGILARQHFACCQNCGRAEIQDDVREARQAGRGVFGYVFYHEQDTEAAMDDGVLCFVYQSITPEWTTEAVGEHLADALRAAGLRVQWSGSARERVAVLDFRWQRRRPERAS